MRRRKRGDRTEESANSGHSLELLISSIRGLTRRGGFCGGGGGRKGEARQQKGNPGEENPAVTTPRNCRDKWSLRKDCCENSGRLKGRIDVTSWETSRWIAAGGRLRGVGFVVVGGDDRKEGRARLPLKEKRGRKQRRGYTGKGWQWRKIV